MGSILDCVTTQLPFEGNSCGQFLCNASKSIALIVKQEKNGKKAIYGNTRLANSTSHRASRKSWIFNEHIGQLSDLFVIIEEEL